MTPDLSRAVYSGNLSDSQTADVIWADGSFRTAWVSASREEEEGGFRWCVASFDVLGELMTAPRCNLIGSAYAAGTAYNVRLASSGDGGLGLLATATQYLDHGFPLLFLRTDLRGTAVSSPVLLASLESDPGYAMGAFAIAWTDSRFAVLWYPMWSRELVIQLLEPAS